MCSESARTPTAVFHSFSDGSEPASFQAGVTQRNTREVVADSIFEARVSLVALPFLSRRVKTHW